MRWLLIIGALTISAPAHAQVPAPPSKTLNQGMSFYHKGDFFSASVEFYRVVHKQTNDSEDNRQRAQFFLAKTMYKLELYAVSLARFAPIVAAGAKHRYYDATLKWLAALARVLPAKPSGVMERIATYGAAAVDAPGNRPMRDELAYIMGRRAYLKHDKVDAINLFERVARTSAWYPAAVHNKALTHVRKYDAKRALIALKALLRAARTDPKLSRFEPLAALQIARLFYATRQFRMALKYYRRVPRTSPDWRDAQYESAWALVLGGDHARALAHLHTLRSPFHHREHDLAPTILQASLYLSRCRHKEANELGQTLAPHKEIRKAAKAILRRHDDSADRSRALDRVLTRSADTPAKRLLVEALDDPEVHQARRWLTALRAELAVFARADKAWQTTAVANLALQELTLQKSLAEADLGKVMYDRATRRIRVLQEHNRDALRLRIEALDRIKSRNRKGRGVADPPVAIAGAHRMWKVHAGFAEGPRGNYRLPVPSKCEAAKAAKPSKQPPLGARQPKSYDFERDFVDGALPDPDFLDTRRRYVHRPSVIRIRRNFIRRMMRSGERLQLWMSSRSKP